MIKDVTASYQCDSVSHQAFSVQAQCFIDQYGNYTVPELIPVLGEEDAHVRKYLEKIARIFSHSKNISVEWKKHAGRKYRGQWRHPGDVQGLHQVRGEPRVGARPARPDSVHSSADALHLVRPGVVRDTDPGVPAGPGPLRPPLPRQVQGSRTSRQLGRLPD